MSSIKKKAPLEEEMNLKHSSPSSRGIELSNIKLSKLKDAPILQLPINIQSRIVNPFHNQFPNQYQRTNFLYNQEMEKIDDFENFNFPNFNKYDFLSFLSHTKKTPVDFLKFYKSNHKDAKFMRMSTSGDKIIEMLSFNSESGPIKIVRYTPDFSIIITTSIEPVIKLWDAKDFHLVGSLEGHDEQITTIFCCNRKPHIISGGMDLSIRVWNLDTQESFFHLPRIHEEEITKILMNNQESLIFTSSKDGTLKIINCEKMRVIRVFQNHKSSVNDFCFCLEERFLISCGNDRRIHCYDNKFHNLFLHAFEMKATTKILQISAVKLLNRSKAVGLMDDGSIIFWDLLIKEQEKVFIAATYQVVFFKVLSETQIFCLTKNQNFFIFDLKSGCEIVKKEVKKPILSLDFFMSKNSQRIHMVTGSNNSFINVWGIEDLTEFRLFHEQNQSISQLLITEDNRYIIFSTDKVVNILDSNTKKIEKTLDSHFGNVTTMHLLKGSKVLVTGSTDHTIKIWWLENNQENSLKKHQAKINAICFSGDENVMISASDDQTLIVWDFAQQKETFSEKNVGEIRHLAFENRNQTFFSAGVDGLIKQWVLHPNLSELRSFIAHGNEITGLVVLNDDFLISSSKDKSIKKWKIESKYCSLESVFYGENEIKRIEISPDECTLHFLEKDNKIGSFSLNENLLEWKKDISNFNDARIKNFKLFPNNRSVILVGSGSDGYLYIWDFNDPRFDQSMILFEKLCQFQGDPYKIKEALGLNLWNLCFFTFLYPIKANIFHYLAYNGETQKMKLLLTILNLTYKKQKEFLLQKDLFGNTAIDIFLDQMDTSSAYFLVDQAIENPPLLNHFSNISEVIRRLAAFKCHKIASLMDSRILQVKDFQSHPDSITTLKNNLLLSTSYFEGSRFGALNHPLISDHQEIIQKQMVVQPRLHETTYHSSLEILDFPYLLDSQNESYQFFENIWNLKDNSIFTSRALSTLIHYKWNSYAGFIYNTIIFFYIFTLLLHLIYSVWLLPLRVRYVNDFKHITDYALVNLVFLCFLSLFAAVYILANAYKLICIGFKRYFLRIKNVYFILNLSLLTITLIFDWLQMFNVYIDEDLIRNLHSFDLFFWVLGIIFLLKPIESFPFARILFTVFEKIVGFCIFSVILIYNLGFVIFILDKNWSFAYNVRDDKTYVYWKEPFETFDLVYRIMIRDFSAYNEETIPLYRMVIWVFFLITSFLLIIVMVNVVIGVIVESQEMIRNEGDKTVVKEKMDICIDVDRMLFNFQRRRLRNKGIFDKYVVISSLERGKIIKTWSEKEGVGNIEEILLEKLNEISKKLQ